MPAHPFNPGPFYWNPGHPHPSGGFRPAGQLETYGKPYHLNPEDWSSKKTIAARLIVGFSVGNEPTYSMEDLIPIVTRVRRQQAGNPSASFVAQRGVYQHYDGKTVVTEDGAQVFIINLDGSSEARFKRQMVELAEVIAAEMQQEAVIVEIQVNGISKITMGVSAPPAPTKRSDR